MESPGGRSVSETRRAADWPLATVVLKVLDLDREVEFYEWFGMTRLSDGEDHAVMGVRTAPLLRLVALPNGRQRPRHMTGLYHFAILVPSEQELGGFLKRTIEERLPLTGSSDHYVSQALYYDDPEGNGIEVYADRPRSEWQYPDGRLNIGIDRLDTARLLRIADRPQKKFPDGTLLGHVHLNVADLEASQAFYEKIGMELIAEYPGLMRFLSWDGYHHHLGINLLEGPGAALVDPGVRGIEGFEVRRMDGPRTDPNGILVRPSSD